MASLFLSSARNIALASCQKSLVKHIGAIFTRDRNYQTQQDSENVVDVVISGGGMVGAAMACALGSEPYMEDKEIILLEGAAKKDSFNLPDNYSNRVCALSPATVKLLDGLGAWEEICNMRYQPVKRMQVWDSCSDSMITFNNDDLTEDLAYIVENDVILAGLTRRLGHLNDRIEVRYDMKAERYTLPSAIEDTSKGGCPFVKVHLENGETLKTRLLIGADGFSSQVRQTAQFHTISWNYQQAAVVATLQISEIENNVAWQRFLPTGPVALLPLNNEYSSLVWSTSTEEAKTLLTLPDDSFVDAVNDAYWHDRDKDPLAVNVGQAFDNLLSSLLPGGMSARQLPPTVIDMVKGSQAMFPLSLVHSSQYVKPKVALIGDAAHRIHPLAGQGVNLGFGDVVCLAKILRKSVQMGNDVGSLTPLLEYETERQRHNVPIMATIDGLQRLYGTSSSPVVVLRSLGLQATNAMKFVKDRIIKQASV